MKKAKSKEKTNLQNFKNEMKEQIVKFGNELQLQKVETEKIRKELQLQKVKNETIESRFKQQTVENGIIRMELQLQKLKTETIESKYEQQTIENEITKKELQLQQVKTETIENEYKQQVVEIKEELQQVKEAVFNEVDLDVDSINSTMFLRELIERYYDVAPQSLKDWLNDRKNEEIHSRMGNNELFEKESALSQAKYEQDTKRDI